jgi:hypothetical protein
MSIPSEVTEKGEENEERTLRKEDRLTCMLGMSLKVANW